jgi:hypothetical protein
MVHEVDEPNSIVGLFDSDGLAGEDLADIDFVPGEADAAAGRDADILVMEGIVEVGQAPIWPWWGPIALRGILHVERLMRALVVAIDEVVKLGLLPHHLRSGDSFRTNFQQRNRNGGRKYSTDFPSDDRVDVAATYGAT